ncbi:prepilin-type N-terminal cleavage/methylation domain-containing protein [Quadrisphaera sp. GCM10027208]|uniref:prepilin-type N-terminal cleavage/methylation domain-containing protein n=1 Tax=Quadrisphaera sp. GCM10027208 TaxID=3273423 RepID=UPI00360945A3
MLRIQRQLRSRLTDSDEGFTLVELVVSMFVISVVLLGLMGVQVQALEGVGLAKQRQQATAIANRTMEQLRALPYDTVAAGLNTSDLAGDPNISSLSGVDSFTPTYDSSISEALQTSTTQATAPLYPHVSTQTLGNVSYRVRSYVSRVDPAADLGYNLTVVVDWASAVTGGQTKETAIRSRTFSPTGCSSSSTGTRPFAGPCEAFFYSDAGFASGGITVAPLIAGDELVPGSGVTGLEVNLPTLSTRTQNEQITSSQSVATTSAASASTPLGGGSIGGQSATSAADTDPGSGTGNSPGAATVLTYSGPTSMTEGGSSGSFSVAVPSSANGSTLSTTASATSPACSDDAGTVVVNNQACSSANVTPDGGFEAEMAVTVGGRDLGPTRLARVESSTTPSTWRAFGARAPLPVAGHCASTTDGGCVVAGARRDFGEVTAGYLPSLAAGDSAPSGFTSMVTVSGAGHRASAESGINPAAGSASRSGTLVYWTGSGYSTPVDLSTLSTAQSISLGTATGSYAAGGSSVVEVVLSGQVVVEPPSVTNTGSAPCKTTACSTVASAGSVRAVVQYDIYDAGALAASFIVTTDLGTTIAQTTYKAAPDA